MRGICFFFTEKLARFHIFSNNIACFVLALTLLKVGRCVFLTNAQPKK
jgi:hypothetical protein